MIEFVFILRNISRENFLHTYTIPNNVTLKYDGKIKIFIKIKTELGVDILLILTFDW